MKVWCIHKWEVVEKKILPSPWEQIEASRPSRVKGKYSGDLYHKSVIVHYRCSKCYAEKIERV